MVTGPPPARPGWGLPTPPPQPGGTNPVLVIALAAVVVALVVVVTVAPTRGGDSTVGADPTTDAPPSPTTQATSTTTSTTSSSSPAASAEDELPALLPADIDSDACEDTRTDVFASDAAAQGLVELVAGADCPDGAGTLGRLDWTVGGELAGRVGCAVIGSQAVVLWTQRDARAEGLVQVSDTQEDIATRRAWRDEQTSAASGPPGGSGPAGIPARHRGST